MSMTTECTVIFKKEYKPKFEEIKKEIEKDHWEWDRIRDLKVIYDGDYVVIIFDCNGSPLRLEDELECEIIEVNYGFREIETMRRNKKTGLFQDSKYKAKTLLKKMIPEEHYLDVRERISYSI